PEWNLGRETSAMAQRIAEQRREDVGRVGFAFRLVEPQPGSGIGPTRESLNVLMRQHIEPAGASYARACGRPIVVVDHSTVIADERFVVIRANPGTTMATAGDWCRSPEEPRGDPSCPELSNIGRLCTDDVLAGMGFGGDPDFLLARSYNGT